MSPVRRTSRGCCVRSRSPCRPCGASSTPPVSRADGARSRACGRGTWRPCSGPRCPAPGRCTRRPGRWSWAGVAGGGRPLEDMRAEDLESVFGAKVSGSWALHQATRTLELDFFVGFSSIASVWGSSGQAHYAAGNHFLDMLAHHRRLRGLPALTINWGPWAETGMGSATELKTWLVALGIQAISPVSGLAALERLLSTDGVQTTVAHVDWSVFKDVYEARGRRPLP